jgi:hypothetical protein
MAAITNGRATRTDRNVMTDVVAGAIAGALGVWVMDQVGWWMYCAESEETRQREKRARAEVGGSEMGPASVATQKINRNLDLNLTEQQQDILSSVIHYGLGVLPGALYGSLRPQRNRIGNSRGLLYGLVLFLLNDELMSVQLGLAAKPSQYPWQAHARGLVTHVALGVATDQAFRLLNRVLGQRRRLVA